MAVLAIVACYHDMNGERLVPSGARNVWEAVGPGVCRHPGMARFVCEDMTLYEHSPLIPAKISLPLPLLLLPLTSISFDDLMTSNPAREILPPEFYFPLT
jgi:hypothetical protein